MDTINERARDDAWKTLLVITIISALLVNLALLYRIVRAAGGLLAVPACPRGVRLQTHVSLIIGDMFVALFSLVVKARVTFEGNSNSIACRTDMLSYVYLTYIMPFVYSAGFLVLVIECAIFRQKVQTAASLQSSGVLLSLAVSAVPWMLGITIALPLTIASADFDDCRFHSSLKRGKAIVWICQILPIIMAVLSTSLNAYCDQNSTISSATVENEQTPVVAPIPHTSQPNLTGISAIPDNGPAQPTAPPTYEEVDAIFAKSHPQSLRLLPHMVRGETSQQPSLQQQQPTPNYFLAQQYQHSGPPFVDQLQYRQNQNLYNFYEQPAYTHPFHGQPSHSQPVQPPNHVVHLPPGSVTYTPNGQSSLLPPSPGISSYYSINERSALVITSFALFVCVIPTATFYLSFTFNEDRSSLELLPLTIISDLCYWLIAIRIVIVPLLWLTTGSFKNPRNR